MPTPYLSFCVHSRNDNHGGDMYRRMRTCLFGFFEQAERHKLNSEIVLVDWNPPKNKPLLKDAYPWPRHSKYCTIRTVVVPPEIHRRYQGWEKIPINNTVGRNVALRRAGGRFILATCIDNLFSDGLFSFLASEKLEEEKMYLIGRTDVKRKAAQLRLLDQQLAYCQKNVNVIQKHSYHLAEPHPKLNELPDLWAGGPGDFTLMAKKWWHQIHGCPETDILGPATDGVSCYMACLAGVSPEILSELMCVYHIDHDARHYSREANWLTRTGLRDLLPKGLLTQLKRLIRQFVPATTETAQFAATSTMAMELAADMVHGKRPFIYNDSNWGLGEEKLEEYLVTQSGSSR